MIQQERVRKRKEILNRKEGGAPLLLDGPDAVALQASKQTMSPSSTLGQSSDAVVRHCLQTV